MISPQIPDLAAFRHTEDDEMSEPDMPIAWNGDDARAVELQRAHAASPRSFKFLLQGIHSRKPLTLSERAEALEAVAQSAVTHELCETCRQRPALPHVRMCKWHALFAIQSHA